MINLRRDILTRRWWLTSKRVWPRDEYFNKWMVINLNRGILTKRWWLTSKQVWVSKPRGVVLGPKRIDAWCWLLWILDLRMNVESYFDLNCTKVYEWRWILWTIGSIVLYPKIFRIRIWILRLIPPPLLKARGVQSAS